MKKLFILFIAYVFGQISAGAITPVRGTKIHCETAGSLIDSLAQKGYTDLKEIASLSVSGHLHAGDFRAFKRMSLDSLDLSDVQIDEFRGAGTYEPGLLGSGGPQKYEAHTLPANAFNFRSDYNNSLTGMEHLHYLLLPTSLKKIDTEALACCSLETISLPEGLEEIATDAFYKCPWLKRIELPRSVAIIGHQGGSGAHYGAFADCTALEEILVDSSNDSFCSIDGVLYSKDKEFLHQYPIGKADKEFEIPSGVKIISHQSFEGATHLEKITFPASVELIEKAFRACENLRTVVCEGQTPPVWYAIGFSSLVNPFDSDLMTYGRLIVPQGTKAIYERQFDLGWGMFQNIEEATSATSLSPVENPGVRITAAPKQIILHSSSASHPASLRIYSSTGQCLYDEKISASDRSYPVPSSGIYIVRINGYSQKIKVY